MKRRLAIALTVAALLLGALWWSLRGAAPQFHAEYAEPQAVMADDAAMRMTAMASAAPAALEAGAVQLALLGAAEPDRYLIRNATLTLETPDPRAAVAAIQSAVRSADGYVSNLRESQDGLGGVHVGLTVRVPEAALDGTLAGIEALGKVLAKNVATQDVTEEFVDLDARIRNMKRAEERILDHLTRTGDLTDIIAVEHELARIRDEVERMEGRMRVLDNRIRFSTIELTVQQTPAAQPVTPAATFSSGKVLSDAVRALVERLQIAWALVIWLAVWSVLWLPALAAVYLIARRLRKSATTRSGVGA